MAERVPQSDYPWWVKFSLWGVHGRNGLRAYMAICVALAAGCVIYSRWNPLYLWGAGFLLAAILYWLSIRWIDAHGTWET